MKRVRILRHAADEALGNLEIELRAEGLNLEVIDCFDDHWHAVASAGFHPADFAGLVVMGGTMNVDQTDRFPFLAVEVGWLRQAARAGLPTLGICLGAQLLARSLDARVYPNAVREIGWYQIELTPAGLADCLLKGSPPRPTVFHWHGDTFDLPEQAVLLAKGETCPHQAFRHGRSYGLQFHPEMTAEMVDAWLGAPEMCADAATCAGFDPGKIRRLAHESLEAMVPFARGLFRRFADFCRATR
jgi:GMP synthase-like glutamine amidotransferase